MTQLAMAETPSIPHIPAPTPVPVPRNLVALVVTYNRLDMIRETLARLLEEPCDLVYVVDNASTDHTPAYLQTLTDPRLRIIRSDVNLGGAGGFELGLRRIVDEVDPEWIVLMDDDGRPASGCLDAFLSSDMSAYDAVSAAVFLRNGEICEMNRPTINPFWSIGTFLRTAIGTIRGEARNGFHIPDEAYRAEPREIDATSFVGLFLPRRTIQRIGYPDGKMFIYGDDVHYTLRLRKAGGTIGFVPSLKFEHDYNRAFEGKRGRFSPLWKAYYTARNGVVVYRFAAGPLFWIAMLIILPKWAMEGRRYGETRRTYYRLIWTGVWDGLMGRPNRPHAEVMSLATSEG